MVRLLRIIAPPAPAMTPRLLPALRWVFRLALVLAIAGAARAADNKKDFNLPAADAAATLKQYAQQAGVELLYSSKDVEGAKTNAVRGSFTPQEALSRLLEGSGLVA